MTGRKRFEASAWAQAGWWTTAVRVGAAIGPLVICALLATDRRDITPVIAVLVLVLWVVAAAATADRLAALIAAVSGGVWFDFFLARPYHQFAIADTAHVVATVLLVLIGIAVAELALWGHRQQAGAARRSGYLDGLLASAAAIREGSAPTRAVTEIAAQQIADTLDVERSTFVDGPIRDARIAVLEQDGTVVRGGRRVDVTRIGLPTDEYVAIPVQRGQAVLGYFRVSSATHVRHPSSEQCRVAVLLADQVAGAFGTASSASSVSTD
ncbi:DUF4118 domain-containing protein [Allobranchiibius sp. GilTou73]|uniref:DUF4118 domain-containing protein n=1 Tax=Allobranchiibius sp. GilTou73 TaxID=2904523 RepID=UPI001F2958CB|nr:DUF4118 domain-containing protein [Allobranchiibius sp. GilTou73]UIJ35161.1 DUF4118 domain-containing protein [Allobranchiibius sp. GilTou73]